MPRNTSGVYSLPAGNPVVSGTLIQSTWANLTMADLASEMTNSLDRNGRGSMLQPFKSVDGSVALPGLTFGNEPSSGLYRAAASNIRMAVAGADVQTWTPSGTTITGALGLTGALTVASLNVTGVSTFTGAVNANNVVNITSAGTQAVLRSGAAGATAAINIGRTATEGYWGVSASPGAFTSIDVAGDMTLRSEQRLFLTLGATGHLRLDSVSGLTAFTSFTARGDVVVPTVSSFRAGIAAGSGFSGWSNFNASADNRNWDVYASSTGELIFRAVNDAYSLAPVWMQVSRTGTNPHTVQFPNSNVGIQRVPTGFSGLRLEVSGAGAFGFAQDEALRLVHNSAYMTYYNSAMTVRTGYFQMLAAGDTALVREIAGNMSFSVASGGFFVSTGGASGLVVSSDGRIWGSRIHNNANGMAGTANQYVGSGTYTPTTVTSTNVSGLTWTISNYSRVGNVVSVVGRVTGNITAAGGTSIVASLPIASAFTTVGDCSGAAAVNTGPAAIVGANTGSVGISITWTAAGAAAFTATFSAQYEVK